MAPIEKYSNKTDEPMIREKILYLHGLESKLSVPKREFLEDYGEVTAPNIEYQKNTNVISDLISEFKNNHFDVIIGSSMGGFIGFYLSKLMKTKALLFNPAVHSRPMKQEIPFAFSEHEKPIQFVLGAKDEIVQAAKTLHFLAENLPQENLYGIHLRNDLEHRIPLKIFKEEVDFFYREF